MEMKMGQVTSGQAQDAQQQHYAAENEIMSHVKNMTLAGKKQLASKMGDHVAAAEQDCKS